MFGLSGVIAPENPNISGREGLAGGMGCCGERPRAIDGEGGAMGGLPARLSGSRSRGLTFSLSSISPPERLALNMTPSVSAGTDPPSAALLRDRLHHLA